MHLFMDASIVVVHFDFGLSCSRNRWRLVCLPNNRIVIPNSSVKASHVYSHGPSVADTMHRPKKRPSRFEVDLTFVSSCGLRPSPMGFQPGGWNALTGKFGPDDRCFLKPD